jgi:hypothetical protein
VFLIGFRCFGSVGCGDGSSASAESCSSAVAFAGAAIQVLHEIVQKEWRNRSVGKVAEGAARSSQSNQVRKFVLFESLFFFNRGTKTQYKTNSGRSGSCCKTDGVRF